MSTISASTTSTTAFKITTDTTGALVFQTGASPTTAMTIDTSQNVGIGTSSPSNKVSIVTASGSDGILSIKSPTTDTAGIVIDGGSASNKGAILKFSKDASVKWQMGIDSAIIGGTTDNFHLYGGGANAMLLSTNATERMRLDASGNLGLGVTPSAWVSSWRALGLGGSTGFGGSLYVNAGGTTGQIGLAQNWYYDGANNRYITSAAASDYYQFGGAHVWRTAGSGTAGNAITFTQAMTLNTNGALALQGGNTSANGVGITFPATQSASTDANTLDDYEEGIWTPSLYAGNANLVSSYNSERYGSYTKIGNTVFFELRISNITLNAQTGSLTIVGLPFTASSSYYFPIYCWMYSGMSSSGTIIIRTELNTTKLVLQSTNTSGVGRDLTQADVSGASVNWMVAGFYSV